MPDIDLRPMSIGEVLDRTFFLYKKNFWLFAGIMALPFVLVFVLRVGLAGIQSAADRAVLTSPVADQVLAAPNATFVAGALIGGLVVGFFTLLLMGAAQAATIFAVSDLYLGRATSVRSAYSRVGKKSVRVLLVLLIVSFAVGVGFVLLIVPGLILLCRTAVSVPVAMLEDSKPVRSVERSMELTKGYWGPIFLIFLLTMALQYAALLIFQGPFLYLITKAALAHHTISFGMQVMQHLAEFLSSVLVGPVGTIAFSLMYYNLRVRKEAFDVQHLMASMAAQPVVNPTPAI